MTSTDTKPPADTRSDAKRASSDDISAMARLACLRVEDTELSALTERFNATLRLFDQLRAAPTQGVEPMSNPMDATQTLREDIVTEANQREALQSTAPAVENGLYLVPRVLE
jgi:aspartyl-tRNA(Asn)/glutamyl-tRNA(Gln) amidotransferase subunit C